MDQKFLISIQGPTASGKTTLALNVATWLKTEIISCDSRQFYKELKIGAAPPSVDELAQVPHHFIHHLSVVDDYNAGDFEKDALHQISSIHQKNDFAVLVGGSGLYADAVINGFDALPTASPEIRAAIEAQFEVGGLSSLQGELKKLDPVYFDQVDKQNPHRLIRALEVIKLTGKPFSLLREKKAVKRPFKSIGFAINWPREELYQRINKRVDVMIKNGLIDEVKQLSDHQNQQPLNTVGYKELFAYFNGEYSLEKAIELIKRNSRRYAKRQLTWLRRNPGLIWVKFDELDRVKEIVRERTGHIDI